MVSKLLAASLSVHFIGVHYKLFHSDNIGGHEGANQKQVSKECWEFQTQHAPLVIFLSKAVFCLGFLVHPVHDHSQGASE